MPVSTTIEIVGVKQAINDLRKIDPQLQKDFKADATAIAQPAINAGKAVYTQMPLSGMKYKWTQRDRKLLSKRLQGFLRPACSKIAAA